MGKRYVYFDWLRLFGVLMVIPFHTAMMYSPYALDKVRSSISSDTLFQFMGFLHQWHMPLLFFISGCATFFMMKKNLTKKLSIPELRGS